MATTIQEFSRLTGIPYHTLYSKRDEYGINGNEIHKGRFNQFVKRGGFSRLNNRVEIVKTCRANGLNKLADLLNTGGDDKAKNLYQLSLMCGIAYHTLKADWGNEAVSFDLFFDKIKKGSFQKIQNRAEVEKLALSNAQQYPQYAEQWGMVAQMMGKPKPKKKQLRIRLTPANLANLLSLAKKRADGSKIKVFANAINNLSLTFTMGDVEIGETKTWRPMLPVEVLAVMDEIILNHLVHLEPLSREEAYKIVANWAMEAIWK